MTEQRYKLDPMSPSWLRSLASQNCSENTIRIYGPVRLVRPRGH
ncbi:hypothetical protein ACFVW2_04660 [Streptomyces sp. NPDC058171]